MTSNLDLKIGFKGQIELNAQAVPLQEGYLKLGGIVDPDSTSALSFGVVVSSDPDDAGIISAGKTSGNIVRGVSVFDDAIAQNSPAHPSSYLQGMPCAVLNHGFMYLKSYTKTSTGAIDPVIGCKVIYNTTTGAIEFIESTGTVADGYAELSNAEVRDVDTDNGALLYLN